MAKTTSYELYRTRQLLLENFDEDIHDLLRVQLDAAEQRLDKIGRWFWQVTQHELQDFAEIDESNYTFVLQQPLNGQAAGRYQLVKHTGKQTKEPQGIAYVYRLNHPLGEWVLEQAQGRELPDAKLCFDYTGHTAKVSVIEKLVGQKGVLRLEKYTIETLERSEDYLIFAAVDATGKVLPGEVAQKLMQIPAQEIEVLEKFCSSDTEAQLLGILAQERSQIEKSVNDRNLEFFEQEVSKLDAWADDLKEALEQTIKELDKEIKQVRREAKIVPTLEEKLALQKRQRNLESERNKSRRELFDRQGEVDEKREALIETLEGKLNKKTRVETLFTLQWSVK